MEWVHRILIEIFPNTITTQPQQRFQFSPVTRDPGIVGIYSYEVAETKMQEATQLLRIMDSL